MARIPHVKEGDILTAEFMNQLIDAIENELPWYCNYCGGANSPQKYSCANCSAPREVVMVDDDNAPKL